MTTCITIQNLKELIINKTCVKGQITINPEALSNKGIIAFIPFNKTQYVPAFNTLEFYYDSDEMEVVSPKMVIPLDEVLDVKDTYIEDYEICGNAHVLITMKNGIDIVLSYHD